MKNNKDGIILGIISILSSLLFVGMPIGKNLFEIVTTIFYFIGLLLIIYFGFIKRNSKNTIITSIVYLIILFILVIFIKMQYKDFITLAIGFIPGLLISISGLILTKNNKAQYKTKVSLVLNIIGLILSIISLLLVIPNGGFIM